MYKILGVRPVEKYEFFMDAFKHQQKHHPDRKIIYSNNGITEVVWKPEWEKINCEQSNFERIENGKSDQ